MSRRPLLLTSLKWPLPQSMSGLIALGYIVATAPLLVAIALTHLSLNQVAGHGQSLIRDGVPLTRLSVQLRDELLELQRGARQYLALRDDDLHAVFEQRLDKADSTLAKIQAHSLNGDIQHSIGILKAGILELAQHWRDAKQDWRRLNKTLSELERLQGQARLMTAASNLAIDKRAIQLKQAAEEARQLVTLSIGVLLPLTVLLALLFTRFISRPLRKARRGITQLGQGDYSQPIILNYPREMLQLGERLDWLRQRLIELEENQDRFLRNVSHEFKTPLASLSEGLSLLSEGKLGRLSEGQTEVLQILEESATELEQLITNLLNYARWQAKRAAPQLSWFDPYALIEQVLKVHRLQLATRAIEVNVDVQPGEVFGDRQRLREALDNLVGNAIKHGGSGQKIDISFRRGPDYAELRVRDYGPGIPASPDLNPFDAFVRGADAEESGNRGTGVGLAIVRETANAHGGHAEICNAKPGARFTLSWPQPASAV